MRLQLDTFQELLKDAGSILNECACSFCTFHCGAAAREAAVKETFEKDNYPPESMPRLMEAMLCCKEPLRTGSGFKGIIIHLLTRSGTVQRDLLARGSGRGRVAGGRAAGWQAAGGRLAGGWRATRGSVAWQWAGADCAPGPRSGGARQWRPAISVELSGLCWAGRGRAAVWAAADCGGVEPRRTES